MSSVVATSVNQSAVNQSAKEKAETIADLQAYWRGDPLPSEIRKAAEKKAAEKLQAAVAATITEAPRSTDILKSSDIPKWTPERKGVVDGGFDRMGEDQSGTILWGYYHSGQQEKPSYFLASSTDRDGVESAVYCSCPSHGWAVKRGATVQSCKHMEALTSFLVK